MPELPEVEHLRRSLEPLLLHRRVASAKLYRPDVCETLRERDGDLVPARTTPADLLQACTIAELKRHGKQLAILSREGPLLLVHLGMSGSLTSAPGPLPKPALHVHAAWTLESSNGEASHLLFRDPRRFGGLWTFPSLAALEAHRWSHLGPDALSLTTAQLARALDGANRPVKAALLDQFLLAGVGNIYADEALFRAGIRPSKLARSIQPPQIAQLAAAIRAVLRQSIRSGGSTLRDYVDASGKKGGAQETHAVYGRSGEACLLCATPLKTAQVAQRTTVWCPSCQR